jgi:SAM-dependent methyltransferase
MTPAPQRYDTIGHGYADFRRADPRIAAQIWGAVGDAASIVNVGAGTGSYEADAPALVAVEPSTVMVAQREPGSAPVVRAAAEHLPFDDATFDVALALMTVHHWSDLRQGLSELRRVSRRQVVFTFDPAVHDSLWILKDYVPGVVGMLGPAHLDIVAEELAADRVEVVPVPADCVDGFIVAYWRRPERYLLPEVRAADSGFARLGPELVEPAIRRLREDLESGAWHQRYADLLALDSLDAGLRLVIAG